MIVCHCKAVNDRRIKALVDDGATMNEIAMECGAGRDCGTCVAEIQAMLDGRRRPPVAVAV